MPATHVSTAPRTKVFLLLFLQKKEILSSLLAPHGMRLSSALGILLCQAGNSDNCTFGAVIKL
jgi:hypothetical protein